MKFDEGDVIVHKRGTEMLYKIIKPIGSDRLKEVYFGIWLTRKTKPHILLEREYISIKNKDLVNWETTDEYKQA